jgi:hypothetical protein
MVVIISDMVLTVQKEGILLYGTGLQGKYFLKCLYRTVLIKNANLTTAL